MKINLLYCLLTLGIISCRTQLEKNYFRENQASFERFHFCKSRTTFFYSFKSEYHYSYSFGSFKIIGDSITFSSFEYPKNVMIEKKDTTISKDGLVLLRMNENPDDYDSIILRNIQDNSKIDVKGVMNSKDRLNLKINSPYVFDFFMDHNWLTPNKKFSSIEFSIDSKKNGSIISSNISNSNHHFQTFNMNGVIKHKKIIFPFNTEFKKSRREANTKLFGLPDSLKCD